METNKINQVHMQVKASGLILLIGKSLKMAS